MDLWTSQAFTSLASGSSSDAVLCTRTFYSGEDVKKPKKVKGEKGGVLSMFPPIGGCALMVGLVAPKDEVSAVALPSAAPAHSKHLLK